MSDILLSWKTTNQYAQRFSPEQWAEFVTWLCDELDPEDLDAVYEFIDRGEGMSKDVLLEYASDSNWVDADPYDTTLIDLNYVNESGVK